MNSNGGGGGGRYHRKPPYSDRLLSIFSTSTSTSTTTGDELTEHDIFDAPSDVSSIPSTSSFPNPNPNPNNNHRKHFGILAVLPESQAPPPASTLLSVSSSSSSSSSTSSARLIPTAPKRPPPPVMDRVKYLQSAPVNVPVMSPARRIGRHFDDVDDVDGDDDVDGAEMLPPHELVASRQSPILASSVLEGAGRKLKGRDLRQVRNAIWRQTGFLD